MKGWGDLRPLWEFWLLFQARSGEPLKVSGQRSDMKRFMFDQHHSGYTEKRLDGLREEAGRPMRRFSQESR